MAIMFGNCSELQMFSSLPGFAVKEHLFSAQLFPCSPTTAGNPFNQLAVMAYFSGDELLAVREEGCADHSPCVTQLLAGVLCMALEDTENMLAGLQHSSGLH
jgi:hypothetical protein